MGLKMKHSDSKGSIWKASAIGVIVSITLSFLLSMLITFMVNKEVMMVDSLDLLSCFIWIISVVTGTLISQKKASGMKLAAVGATALCYIIILSVFAIALFEANIGSIGKGAPIVLIGVIPAIIAILKKSKKEKVKFKI